MIAVLTILDSFFILALLGLLELPGVDQGIRENVIFHFGMVAGIAVCEIMVGIFAITIRTCTSRRILVLYLSVTLILAPSSFVFFDYPSTLYNEPIAILLSLIIIQIIIVMVLLLYVLNDGLQSYNPKRSDSSTSQRLVFTNMEKV